MSSHDLEGKLREALAALAAAEEDAANADQDAEHFEKKMKAAVKESKGLSAQVAKLQAENAQLAAAVTQAKQQLSSRDTELADLRIKFQALEQQLISRQELYEAQLTNLRSRLAQVTSEAVQANEDTNNKQRQELEALTTEVRTLRANDKKLRDKLKIAEARADFAEDKIFEANEAAQRAEEDAIQADKDADRFERKWKQAAAEVKELRATLARLQAQHASEGEKETMSPATPLISTPLAVLHQSSVSADAKVGYDSTNPTAAEASVSPLHAVDAPMTSTLPVTQLPKQSNASEVVPQSSAAPAKQASIPVPVKLTLASQQDEKSTKSHPASTAAAVATISSILTPKIGAKATIAPATIPTPMPAPAITTQNQVPKSVASQSTFPTSSQTKAVVNTNNSNTTRPSESATAKPSWSRNQSTDKEVQSTRIRKTEQPVSSAAPAKKTGKAAMLEWCQNMARGKYEITNFSGSFADGLAFCAMMHRVFPSKIPWSELSVKTRERNFTLAFKVAEDAGVEPLLDVEDMVAMERPDPLSVMTYISFLYKRFGKTPC